MLFEKICFQKLKLYTENLITNYNSLYYPEFLHYCKNIVTKENKHEEEILKIFYFNKFFDLFLKNKIIKKDQMLDNNFAAEIEKEILNTFMSKNLKRSNAHIYKYFKSYGNFQRSLLNSLYDKYEKLENDNEDKENLFLKISKIFLLNSYKEKDWESICTEKIPYVITSYELDSLTMKLLKYMNKKGEIENLSEFKTRPFKRDETKTATQSKLKETLCKMNINFEEEYSRDDYTYDYYLPELDIVLEYDGPDHFYPLQTQLTEQSKFRYRNIKENFKSKIVIVPYFEYLRYDNADSFEYFLRKLIFKEYDILEGPLFQENFDKFKPVRNYDYVDYKKL